MNMDAYIVLPRKSTGFRRCPQGKMLTGRAEGAKLIPQIKGMFLSRHVEFRVLSVCRGAAWSGWALENSYA